MKIIQLPNCLIFFTNESFSLKELIVDGLSFVNVIPEALSEEMPTQNNEMADFSCDKLLFLVINRSIQDLEHLVDKLHLEGRTIHCLSFNLTFESK